MPIADSGDVRNIPEQTPTGSNQLSFQSGFPSITSIPLTAGGVPPQREDFNAAYKILSQHTFFQQSGGVYPWQGADGDFAGLNYLAGWHVQGSDGGEYVAKLPSGPDVLTTDGGFVGPQPVTNTTYWRSLTEIDIPIAGPATATANGTPNGIVNLAADNALATARDIAATPAHVAAQIAAIPATNFVFASAEYTTGTSPTITASSNISSLTRPATGKRIVVMANAAPDMNYKIVASVWDTSSSGAAGEISYRKTSTTTFELWQVSGTGNLTDGYGGSFIVVL
jgi:hypothetical protein